MKRTELIGRTYGKLTVMEEMVSATSEGGSKVIYQGG